MTSTAFMEVSPEPAQGGGGGFLTDLKPIAEGRTLDQDRRLLAWGQEKYTQHKAERIPIERSWYVNLAFQAGKQNIAFMNTSKSSLGFALHVPKAPPWRVRMVINHCRRIVRTECAKLASQRPRPFVVPATTEDEDQTASRIGETILEAAFSTHDFGTTNRSWIWWGSVIGTSFLKQYWDPSKLADDKKTQGDICIERLNPFEIFIPNLMEESLEKQPYVIHAQTKSVEEVKRYYKVDVQPNAIGVTNMIEDSFLNLIGAQQMRNDKVLVLEFWCKPGYHDQFPNGGMFTIAGDRLVQVVTEMPYKHQHFPFYKHTSIPTGMFYGDSVLVDTIPLQREVNRTRSQIVENKNLMSKPKLMAPKGSINPKQITSEPGQIILYTPGYEKPDVMPTPPLPAYVSQELERLSIDMDDISGQHEITRGNNPSQVTAATALSYLQEQDDSKLYYAVASLEDAISQLGSDYLEMASQYWTSERMVRVVGTEGIVEAEAWKGSDLRGNTDVRVMTGSGLPQSKAAKQAFIMDLLKFGFLPPEKGIEMLEIGGMERIYEEVLIDKRAATRENILMSQMTPEDIDIKRASKAAETLIAEAQSDPMQVGQMALESGDTAEEAMSNISESTMKPLVEVNSWDNHQLHIEQHNRFRKTQRFALLPNEVKAEFELHVVEHQNRLREDMAIQAGIDPNAEQGMPGGVASEEVDPEVPFAEQQTVAEEPQFGMNRDFTSGMNNDMLDGSPGMGTAGI
jgi:hypothetical protein